MESETKTCQSCKAQFTIAPEDFDFYNKISVPPPTWCPECRMIRRFVFRNERQLFRRPDSRTGKEIFSAFPPGAPIVAYDTDFWFSDGWDPLASGHDFDFSRSFFQQFKNLLQTAPWPARSFLNAVNSDYINNVAGAKNAYLSFDATDLENTAYVVVATSVKESVDLYEARHSDLCYDNYMSDESYRVFFSVNCEESTDIWFSRNLLGCSNCFGCVNLRNKSYYVFNKSYSKEAYKKYMEKLDLASYRVVSKLKQEAHQFWLKYPMRFTLVINAVDSSGEHIEHSKNVRHGYSIHEGENLRYCQNLGGKVVDSYDHFCGSFSSNIYDTSGTGGEVSNIKFSWECWGGLVDVEYSASCFRSSNLLGCVGLHSKQYCIFNKQYSKEEYHKLREKIIAHMNEMPYTDKEGRVYRYGEFFPPEFSPFAYNETIAQDFFPLTKTEAEAQGYLWREPETRNYPITINYNELPDNIKDVSDTITKEVIGCESCGGPFRIIPMELQFYRRIPLPLPHKCPECRFKDRFKFVNPPKFWPAKCRCAGKSDDRNIYTNQNGGHVHGADHCPNKFETSYAPGRPEIVYCESCYNAEVI